ncbi:MAG: glycosyltransferase, partial [Candidatus Omnitrophota bacterium]
MDISIIIPTYNRRKKLERCLKSFFVQDYPQQSFEIIVVDDNSKDGTKEMVEELAKEQNNLFYSFQPRKGPAAARNLGIKRVRGEIIGFTDDDCEVDKNWVKLMVESHRKNPKITAVGGLTDTFCQKSKVIVSQSLSNGAIQIKIGEKEEVIFFPTCNVSFKRQIFDKYKFNENFSLPGGEDLEFFWRLFKYKHRFVWNKNIKVIHNRDKSLSSFVRQAYIYGRGNLLTQYRHKDHPLLKELKTGKIFFWAAVLINFII